MKAQSARRRGVALLLVLATLVLAVTAAAALARAALNARLHAAAAAEAVVADELLRAAEAPILDWLHRHAGRVSLPPGCAAPRFALLDDRMAVSGVECHVAVTAFDQCGMVSGADRSGAWGTRTPAGLVERIERLGETWRLSPGLDLLRLGEASPLRVYPSCRAGAGLAAGEVVATHNPVRAGATALINVNTAPMPLIEAVYAARGLGGVEAIAEARAAGRIASPGAMQSPRVRVDGLPLPVSMSTAWVFRVDCSAGRTRRSWWCVYADSGSNWEMVQRLAIEE